MERTIYVFSPNISRTGGGISNTAYYICKYMSSKHKTIAVTNMRCDKSESVNNVTLVPSEHRNVVLTIISQLRRIKQLMQKTDCKTVSICMTWRYALIPCFSHLFKRSKFIVLCHGNDVYATSGASIKELIENHIRKKVIAKALCICCNSAYTEALVKKIKPDANTRIVHPCYGVETTREYRATSKKENKLVTICRLEERKGVQDVLEAMKEIHKKYPEIVYEVAGTGDFREELETLIETNRQSSYCKLLGVVTEKEKEKLLSDCFALVMPSFDDTKGKSIEGFGITFIEANAFGKPVIGTKSGGISDAIKDRITGLLINERDTHAICDAVCRLYSEDIYISTDECLNWADQHHYINICQQYDKLIGEMT